MPAGASTRRLAAVAIAVAAILVAGVWYLTKDPDATAAIPASDRQIPTSGPVLESDRPDLLEERAFEKREEEPEPE